MIAAAAPLVPAIANAAVAAPVMPTLKTVRADLLQIAYAEYGPAAGPAAVLLHGWPRFLITGGIGHNLRQEPPAAFVQGMFDVAQA